MALIILISGGLLYVIVLSASYLTSRYTVTDRCIVSVGFATVGSAVKDPVIRLPIVYSK